MSRIVIVILIYHRYKPTDLNKVAVCNCASNYRFTYVTKYLLKNVNKWICKMNIGIAFMQCERKQQIQI
jgi:hypothetical protein